MLEYWRRGNIQLNASLWIAVGLFFGAWVGAVAAQRIPSAHLQRGFAVFLLVVGGFVLYRNRGVLHVASLSASSSAAPPIHSVTVSATR